MDRLWSPWRAAHVSRWAGRPAPSEQDQSIFEAIAAAGNDEAGFIFWRGKHWFALLNLYPYNNGHSLLVPYRRVADYTEMTTEEQVELAGAIGKVMGWTRTALAPHGFNVGINQGQDAGAGIPEHLHVHIVPRWSSDTNFMPATAGVKVIPEALQTTYRKMVEAVSTSGDG